MNVETKSTHVTPVGGNVFADLGFGSEEAKAYKAETDRIIAETKALKYQLMADLTVWIESEKLKQAEAALILGVNRPRVSDVVNKKATKFTIDALVEMVARTGRRVQLTVV